MKRVETAYPCRDGRTLPVTLRLPDRRGRLGVLLDLHGGTWTRGDRSANGSLARALVSRCGVAVASIEFRQGPACYPATLDDIADAVDWLQGAGPQWSLDPDRIGLAGSSSGGHLALLAGLGGTGRCVLGFWPIVSTLRALADARRAAAGRTPYYTWPAQDLVRWQTEYFGDEGAVARADLLRRVEEPVAARPPVLLVQARGDRRHPLATAEAFATRYRVAGGRCAVLTGPEAAIFRQQADSGEGRAVFAAIDRFLRRTLD